MGLPEGHVTAVDLTRRAMLRVLGNGVVPPQAAHAITDLLKNLTPLAPIAPGAHPILGRPWGHGATAITRVDRNTPCADCARPLRTLDDRLAHLMPDGLTICTPCARTRAAIHHPDLYTQGATP